LLAPELMSLNDSDLLSLYNYIEENKGDLRILDDNYYNNIKSKAIPKMVVRKGDNLNVEVLSNFSADEERSDINGFIRLYTYRYHKLSEILKQRTELQNAIPIKQATEVNNDNVAVLGMISSVNESKNGNLIVSLEDPSGVIRCIISSRNSQLFQKAQLLVVDEVIGVVGNKKGIFILVENLFFPDIPNSLPIKKVQDDVSVAYLSDIHVGSKDFMGENFQRAIDFLKSRNDIGYIFVTGDLVDGVGIYPSQEQELEIKDIYKQFQVFSEFIKQLPDDKQIIIAPGNHDGMRLAEPQPPLFKEFLPDLYNMKNITMVSNPAYVNIHKTPDFDGFTHLMYHGYSFDHYCLDVQALRTAGGYGRIDKVVEFLLKKRHLVPVHGSTLIKPAEKDRLIIDKIPDVVTTGHVHNLRIGNYKHINLIGCACFQRATGDSFQERLGHLPTPGLVPVMSLKNREVNVFKF